MDPIETIAAILDQFVNKVQCIPPDTWGTHMKFAKQALICVALTQNMYTFDVVETPIENIGVD
jgi:hypothetical protein